MDRHLAIPLDVESRMQFRMLAARTGSKAKAVAAVFILWRELAYSEEEFGWVRGAQMELLRESLAGICAVEDLVDGFLAMRPGGEGLYCALFVECNPHLAPDFVPMQKRGGLARALKYREQDARAAAVVQGELLQPELFAGLDTDDRNRVVMIIKLLDNVLGRRERARSEFTPGLVEGAKKVAECEDGEINNVCQKLMALRGAGGAGLNTERVLRDWQDYARGVRLAA